MPGLPQIWVASGPIGPEFLHFPSAWHLHWALGACRRIISAAVSVVPNAPLRASIIECNEYTDCACTQAIACLILFTFANVLSTLLAKLMASHFHKATHFYKMQEAIRKASCGLNLFPVIIYCKFRQQWSQPETPLA